MLGSVNFIVRSDRLPVSGLTHAIFMSPVPVPVSVPTNVTGVGWLHGTVGVSGLVAATSASVMLTLTGAGASLQEMLP
ncbi:hypothetical protein ACS04_32020 [Streptomyces roseus]|uniref:Uncharacterized protein n=1 Tax=Streptomyces roseus TaxID=66430 RepID=A0A0J6XFH5_9ACTN|nr:hypothetical protein ACS04_32020 [Streptomyces roseus]